MTRSSVLVASLTLTLAANVPVWPFQFSATLAKVNPETPEIVWTKLYYDYKFSTGGASRFDFYNAYVDDNAQWSLNCSVLFVNQAIWHLFPSEETCHLRATDIPSVSPYWLQNLKAKYAGIKTFRGVKAELWEMPDPDQLDATMRYYAHASNNSIPLRSPNQVNDPGNTDFFDVFVGAQDTSLFTVPTYCKTLTSNGCPWY